ncbi:MAG: hypothetical protein K9G62_04215 [Alphaproteobacteria bacterium]|nr:hypothetical protein [Alphaproteobacteria bacterium]
MGGCTGGYIDNPDTDTLFHYDPFQTGRLDNTIRRKTFYEKTKKVSFFVLQEYEQDGQGEWQPRPEPVEAKDALKNSTRILELRKIPYEFFQYWPDPKSDNSSTAAVDREGKISLWGKEIPHL